MANEEDPKSRQATHVAGAFLGPGGTFPASLHTLSDEVHDEPRLEAELSPREPTPIGIGWAIGLAIAVWTVGSIILAIAIGAMLALTGNTSLSDRTAAILGYADMLLLVPGALAGVRAERIRDRRAFAIVIVAAAIIAVVATVVPAIGLFVLAGSIAVAVTWRVKRR